MRRDEIRRALVAYGTVPRRQSHGEALNRMLDRTPCEDCGQPVGREARGSKQCLACLGAECERGVG